MYSQQVLAILIYECLSERMSMNRIRFGLVAGVVFGAVDVLPMLSMEFSDPLRTFPAHLPVVSPSDF